MGKINKEWHLKNKMPKTPTLNQKIQWHVNHTRECACREMPPNVKKLLPERKPKVVVSVLLKYKNKYLLAKEAVEDGHEKWLIPGGKVEFGETLEAAARREIKEEVDIDIGKFKHITFYEAVFPDFNYHTVIFFYTANVKKNKLGKDIEGKVIEANWYTPKEAKKLLLVPSAEWLFKKFL